MTMKHALSGIKFRNGHPNGTMTKTIITRVELIGLNKYGKGSVGEDGVVNWDPVNPVLRTVENPFFLVFDNPTYTRGDGASKQDGTITSASRPAGARVGGDYVHLPPTLRQRAEETRGPGC